jgi:rhodanese-related sulfurtransferase
LTTSAPATAVCGRPVDAYLATQLGSLLIDTRDGEQCRRDGLVPGALGIDRTVLEWRIDPESGATHPAITSLHVPLILLCHEGYSSSLAVGSLLDLGVTDVTDVEGGFEAWRAAGLPVAPYTPHVLGPEALPSLTRG